MCSLSPLCIGLCRVSVDAWSCVVARFRAPCCNGLPREIAWRVYVFGVSLCQRLFVVAPLVAWLRVRWLCVASPNVIAPRSGGLASVAFLHVLLVCAPGRRARFPWILGCDYLHPGPMFHFHKPGCGSDQIYLRLTPSAVPELSAHQVTMPVRYTRRLDIRSKVADQPAGQRAIRDNALGAIANARRGGSRAEGLRGCTLVPGGRPAAGVRPGSAREPPPSWEGAGIRTASRMGGAASPLSSRGGRRVPPCAEAHARPPAIGRPAAGGGRPPAIGRPPFAGRWWSETDIR